VDFDAYHDNFRRHYEMTYVGRGGEYASYALAYRYGYDLAAEEQYQNREWVEMEPEVRQRWEAEHPGTWGKFKDAIFHAWKEVTLYKREKGNIKRAS
jgi:hypothetical protein